jgi:tRNA(adenine34) deaminase
MKKWVKDVTTDSTFPPAATFKKPAKKVAQTMADPKVSPKGLGSAIRMVQYFINRGGKNLPAGQKRELEKAKRLLQEKNAEEKQENKETNEKSAPKKRAAGDRARKKTKPHNTSARKTSTTKKKSSKTSPKKRKRPAAGRASTRSAKKKPARKPASSK